MLGSFSVALGATLVLVLLRRGLQGFDLQGDFLAVGGSNPLPPIEVYGFTIINRRVQNTDTRLIHQGVSGRFRMLLLNFVAGAEVKFSNVKQGRPKSNFIEAFSQSVSSQRTLKKGLRSETPIPNHIPQPRDVIRNTLYGFYCARNGNCCPWLTVQPADFRDQSSG